MKDVRTLGLVPARGGSKGIPRKNLADLGGKPLVQHTIEAALESSRLDAVVVTSDDPEILAVAERVGATPLQRPDELATDDAPMLDTALHALDDARERWGDEPDTLVLLQPTSPFRPAASIDASIGELERTGADTLASVVEVDQHPCDCVRFVAGGLEWAVPLPFPNARRQDLPEFHYVDGAIYVVRTAYLRSHGVFVDERTAVYVQPRSHGFDIDSPWELALARALLARGTLD